MVENDKNLENENPNSVTSDDRSVMEKESYTSADLKNAFSDTNMTNLGDRGAQVLGPSISIVFSIMLVATGLLIGFFTYYSIIGLILGLIMIIAGIAIPFGFAGRRTQSQ